MQRAARRSRSCAWGAYHNLQARSGHASAQRVADAVTGARRLHRCSEDLQGCRLQRAAASATQEGMKRLHPAWMVAAGTFLVLLVAAAIRATPGVLIVPFEHEFGWTRATISAAVSVNLLLYGLMGPFCAAIADRFGVRRTMAFAMALLSIALLFATTIQKPWHLVLVWGFFVGTGTGMVALVLGAVVVTRWFTRHRGLVMGALTASTATGQLLFLPVLAHVAESDGWRWAVRIVA